MGRDMETILSKISTLESAQEEITRLFESFDLRGIVNDRIDDFYDNDAMNQLLDICEKLILRNNNDLDESTQIKPEA